MKTKIEKGREKRKKRETRKEGRQREKGSKIKDQEMKEAEGQRKK